MTPTLAQLESGDIPANWSNSQWLTALDEAEMSSRKWTSKPAPGGTWPAVGPPGITWMKKHPNEVKYELGPSFYTNKIILVIAGITIFAILIMVMF